VTGRRSSSCVRRSSLAGRDWSTFSRNCVEFPGVRGVGRSKSWGKVASRNFIGSTSEIPGSNLFRRPLKREENSFRRTLTQSFVGFSQRHCEVGGSRDYRA